MRKLREFIVFLCVTLIMMSSQTAVAQALTIEEQRAKVSEILMMGVTETFTSEEVEAYLSMEEAKILETGTFAGLGDYGFESGHSTAQRVTIFDYLTRYFNENTTVEDLAVLYPFAVDFESLPVDLNFYEMHYQGFEFINFEVRNQGDRVSMTEYYWSEGQIELNEKTYNGTLKQNGTKEIQVAGSNTDQARMVPINTEIIIQEESHYRTDYAFYFFYNDQGGLSLLRKNRENQGDSLTEFATKETVAELEGDTVVTEIESTPQAAPTAINWRLPADWRMVSPRRQNVPPVTWVLTSVGDGESFAGEPIFGNEGIISGYIHPNYSVEIATQQKISNDSPTTYRGYPDETGYFSIESNAAIGYDVTIKIMDETNRSVFESSLNVHQYRPTALAHDSGYLTLERYFVNQNYVEGYTYPNAEVRGMKLDGYASTGVPPVTADETGYFYMEITGHPNNVTTNVISVTHPETGAEISISPYPWTHIELDHAQW